MDDHEWENSKNPGDIVDNNRMWRAFTKLQLLQDYIDSYSQDLDGLCPTQLRQLLAKSRKSSAAHLFPTQALKRSGWEAVISDGDVRLSPSGLHISDAILQAAFSAAAVIATLKDLLNQARSYLDIDDEFPSFSD